MSRYSVRYNDHKAEIYGGRLLETEDLNEAMSLWEWQFNSADNMHWRVWLYDSKLTRTLIGCGSGNRNIFGSRSGS